jgi:hypothetical protein
VIHDISALFVGEVTTIVYLQRYHKHTRINAAAPKQSPHIELLQHFPRVKAARSLGKTETCYVLIIMNFSFVSLLKQTVCRNIYIYVV